MMEMKYVLQDVTDKSLVLVDELGKGTEAKAGAALAGAMLEALDRSGCLGAFATHLHDLLEMELSLNNTTRMKMEVEARDDGAGRLARRPTHRIVPGESTESLALEVARDCNLPSQTVERAAELYAAVRIVEDRGEDAVETGGVEGVARARSGPGRPFPDLEGILLSTAARILGDGHGDGDADADDPSTNPLKVYQVPRHALPGTQITNRSCVYVARTSDDRFYVGSSDQLRERILTHRNPSSGTSSQVKDKDAEFLYVVLPDSSAGSSTARAIEAAVIKECLRCGIPLLSTHDAAIKSAPIRARRRTESG
jgi:predicted GIY-YIG superfamily endonuclease